METSFLNQTELCKRWQVTPAEIRALEAKGILKRAAVGKSKYSKKHIEYVETLDLLGRKVNTTPITSKKEQELDRKVENIKNILENKKVWNVHTELGDIEISIHDNSILVKPDFTPKNRQLTTTELSNGIVVLEF